MLLIDETAHANRWRSRHPGEKAFLALGLLLLAVALPPWPGAVLTGTAALALLLGGARVPWRTTLRLLALPLGFVIVGALPLLVTVGGDPWLALAPGGPARAAALVGRSLAAVSCLILFAATTPLADTLPRLRWVPPAVLEITLLVYRMLFLLLDSLTAVREAQSLRMGFRTRRTTFRSLAGQGGAVFVRAFDRARRLEAGLASRGYDGSLRVRVPARTVSPAFVAASTVLLVAVPVLAPGGRPVTAVLEARGLVFAYPDGPVVLDGADLVVDPGRRLAVLGPNGGGKTTLFRLLLGLLAPSAGQVLLDGEPVRRTRRGLVRLRESAQLVLQDPDDQLFSADVAQDVSFGPLNLGLDETEVDARVHDALSAVGIADLADRPTHRLSFGQRKRVAIAGALAVRPRVLVLDEPTAGLDPAGVEELVVVLADLQRAGTAVVLSTHDVDLAHRWADDVAVVARGRVRRGPAAEILGDAALLSEARLGPAWAPAVARLLALAGRPGVAPGTAAELHDVLSGLATRETPARG